MTRPAIPTTMRTTPTVDRLIPLTDVVTANFRIAPIAINTKLEPILISRSPSWGSWTFQGYPGRKPYASLPCGTGRGCVALRPVDRLGLFVQGVPGSHGPVHAKRKGTPDDHSRNRAYRHRTTREEPRHTGNHRHHPVGDWSDPVGPGLHGSRRRRSQALLLTGGLTILTDAPYGGRGRSSNLPPHAIHGPGEKGAL